MPHLPSYLHPFYFGMQMCHLPSLPHIYLSVFTYFICDIYARSEFVQIYLILSMLSSSCIACILGAGKAP